MVGQTGRGFSQMRAGVAGLALPAGLLVFSRLVACVPVIGALSSNDGVAFWSFGAFLFFAAYLVLAAALFVAAYFAFETDGDWEPVHFFGSLFWGWLVIFLLSEWLLPFGGWEQLLVPFTQLPALVRIFFFTPMTPVLAGAALLLQLILLILGSGRARLDLARPLLLVLFLAGVWRFAAQPASIGTNWQALNARLPAETRQIENPRDANGVEPAERYHNEQVEVQEFLLPWVESLADNIRCGATLVDWPSPGTFGGVCQIADLTRKLIPPDLEPSLSSLLAAGLSFALVFLAWILSGLGRKTAFAANQAAQLPRRDDIGGTAELVLRRDPSAWSAIRHLICGCTLLAALLAALIPHPFVVLTALSIAALLLPAVLYTIAAEQAILNPSDARLNALVSRDRRGARAISPVVARRLHSHPQGDELLETLPASSLLLFPILKKENAGLAATFLGGSAAVPGHPGATLLTRVDYAVCAQAEWRAPASAALPVNLFPRALKRLVDANFEEPQLAALRCPSLPRGSMVKLLRTSPAEDVRSKAWELIAPPSQAERLQALASPHSDVRLRSLQAGPVPVHALFDLCSADPAPEVRAAAWDLSRPNADAAAVAGLCLSAYPDARMRAVQSGLLSKQTLAPMWLYDTDPGVRLEAGRVMIATSSAEELEIFLHADSVEVRRQILEDAGVPPQRLLLAAQDEWHPTLRRRCLERHEALQGTRLPDGLARSSDPQLRLAAVSWLNRELMFDAAVSDPSPAVRKAAFERLGPCTVEETGRLAKSVDASIRVWAAGYLPLASRELQTLRLDPIAEVRAAAQHRTSRVMA